VSPRFRGETHRVFANNRTPKGTKDVEHDEQTAVTTSCGPGRQAQTPEGDTRSHPKVGYRGPAAGIEDTFPRFGAFRRNQMHRSLRAGLPPQRLPLAGFRTLSAVSSRYTLWLYFKPHPPLGFMGLQSFSRRGQPWCLSAPIALLPSGTPQRVGQADRACGRRPISHPANRTNRQAMPLEALVPELCSNRASDTPFDESTSHGAAALLAFVLFEACQPGRWV